MTLDQVPTEERTPPLNLTQVPLEKGRGRGRALFFFFLSFILIIDFDLDMPGPDGMHFQKRGFQLMPCAGNICSQRLHACRLGNIHKAMSFVILKVLNFTGKMLYVSKKKQTNMALGSCLI